MDALALFAGKFIGNLQHCFAARAFDLNRHRTRASARQANAFRDRQSADDVKSDTYPPAFSLHSGDVSEYGSMPFAGCLYTAPIYRCSDERPLWSGVRRFKHELAAK